MATAADDFAYQLAHINESRKGHVIAVNAAMITVSTVSVTLRFVSRRLVNAPIKYDDYAILVALFTSWITCTIDIISCHYGEGKHAFADFAEIENFLKVLYAYTVVYAVCVPTIKISILLFYYRIFTTQPWVRILQFVGAFLSMWLISATLVAINQCTPIAGFWDRSLEARCINSYAWILAEGAVTILADIVLLVIPMPMVWQLKLPKRQKAALMGVFLLGGFVCVTSIIRMPTLKDIFTNDLTWTSYAPSQWSVVEATFGIVCACLPVMRPLFRRRARHSSSNASRGLRFPTIGSKGKKVLWTDGTTANETTMVEEDRESSHQLQDLQNPDHRAVTAYSLPESVRELDESVDAERGLHIHQPVHHVGTGNQAEGDVPTGSARAFSP